MNNKVLCTALISLLPAISIAATQVYKTVNPDGSISYSDESTPSAEVMMVEPIPTVPAFKPPATQNTTDKQDKAKQTAIYSQVSITAPPNGETFYSGSGNLEIKIESTPSLQAGHRIRVEIDGNVVTEQRSTSFSISNVDRGTHTLTATILDEQANELAGASSSFTIHRPTVK